jgi:hypothetical protein
MKYGLQEAGSSIMIMHQFTWHCQLDNSWQNIQFLPFHNPPIYLISSFPTFLFPKIKLPFQTVEDNITNATNDLKVISQTSFEQFIAVQQVYFEEDNIQ